MSRKHDPTLRNKDSHSLYGDVRHVDCFGQSNQEVIRRGVA